jgi:uncharacterized protein
MSGNFKRLFGNVQKPVAFQVMAKPISSTCNLNCTYCYYLEKEKLYKGAGSYRMNDVVLESFIKQYIEAQETPVVSFIWQGGEPTLKGVDFYRRAVELQKKYANGRKIENALQTNGTLLNDEWCEFLKENNFLVGISIDGPQEIHDLHRPTKAGSSSFDKVIKGIELLKKHKIEFNTLTVVNSNSSKYPLEIYRFLKEIGSTYIQFLPVVERKAQREDDIDLLSLVSPAYKEKTKVTDWSVRPADYGNFLIIIFNEWVRNDVGRYFVQLFDVTLANWVGEHPGLCVFAETCGDALVIEHNGDVYSCDHFVYPEYSLGNINQTSLKSLARSETQKAFGQSKLSGLPNYCIRCEYRFACHGECPKHRFDTTPDGEPGLNYLCKAYKMFFSHVHPYMQYMGDELAAQRPPSNVMQWARRIHSKKIPV